MPFVWVRWKKLHPEAQVPSYATDGAAGADLCAVFDKDSGITADNPLGLEPGERVLVKTGVAIELPFRYEAQVRPRSGLALKHGITVLNAPGTIDSDYRGDIGVILYNAGSETFWIKPGDRIAQLVVSPIAIARFMDTGDVLSETERGAGGFGSTGREAIAKG